MKSCLDLIELNVGGRARKSGRRKKQRRRKTLADSFRRAVAKELDSRIMLLNQAVDRHGWGKEYRREEAMINAVYAKRIRQLENVHREASRRE